jgi:mRNA interferase MazF
LGCRGQIKTVEIEPKRKPGDSQGNSAYVALQRQAGVCALTYIKMGGLYMERKVKRGDMFFADLTHGVGSEQSGYRPVLIIQNNTGNKHSQTVIATLITSKTVSKAKMPTHCPINAQQRLGRDSLVLLEQIRTIDKARLHEYIGTLDAESMRRIDKALAVSVGLKEGSYE